MLIAPVYVKAAAAAWDRAQILPTNQIRPPLLRAARRMPQPPSTLRGGKGLVVRDAARHRANAIDARMPPRHIQKTHRQSTHREASPHPIDPHRSPPKLRRMPSLGREMALPEEASRMRSRWERAE